VTALVQEKQVRRRLDFSFDNACEVLNPEYVRQRLFRCKEKNRQQQSLPGESEKQRAAG
jgi:hypothetical protein